MRELAIHVGYPKAASTTLQNSLFLQLHQQGLINFIGRAWESDQYGPADNHKDYKNWFWTVRNDGRRQGANGKAHPDVSLAEDRLNLLSEGLFLVTEDDPRELTAPANIASYFGRSADTIRLLFVLRAQTSLIMSFYLQTYRLIAQKDFGRYVEEMIQAESKGRFKIFYFDNVVDRYAEVFGKENLEIVFFEDLVKDLDHLSTRLGGFLKVDNGIVKALLEGAHHNKTPKDPRGSVVRHTGRKPVTVKLRNALAKSAIIPGLKPAPRPTAIVPAITDAQKQFILDSFRKSNLRLAENYGLDKERMKAYGYV